MKRIKSLALDKFSDIYDLGCCLDEESYLKGYEAGFHAAFNFIMEQMDIERELLKQYPLTSERMFGIIKMQEKLRKMLEEIK